MPTYLRGLARTRHGSARQPGEEVHGHRQTQVDAEGRWPTASVGTAVRVPRGGAAGLVAGVPPGQFADPEQVRQAVSRAGPSAVDPAYSQPAEDPRAVGIAEHDIEAGVRGEPGPRVDRHTDEARSHAGIEPQPATGRAVVSAGEGGAPAVGRPALLDPRQTAPEVARYRARGWADASPAPSRRRLSRRTAVRSCPDDHDRRRARLRRADGRPRRLRTGGPVR